MRNTLTAERISALLFIRINGPPVELFKPADYVKSWLLHHRDAEDRRNKCMKKKLDETSLRWKYL